MIYKLNKAKSIEVYEKCKHLLEIKECYNNTFKIMSEYGYDFWKNNWKIAYGYTRVFSHDILFVRHAFILDENNDVVDATYIFTDIHKRDIEDDKEYFVMKIFNNGDEYLDAIMSDNGYPALFNYLAEENRKLNDWATKQGYLLCG